MYKLIKLPVKPIYTPYNVYVNILPFYQCREDALLLITIIFWILHILLKQSERLWSFYFKFYVCLFFFGPLLIFLNFSSIPHCTSIDGLFPFQLILFCFFIYYRLIMGERVMQFPFTWAPASGHRKNNQINWNGAANIKKKTKKKWQRNGTKWKRLQWNQINLTIKNN